MQQSFDIGKVPSNTSISQVQHLLRMGRLLTLRHVYLMQSKPRCTELNSTLMNSFDGVCRKEIRGELMGKGGKSRGKSEGKRRTATPNHTRHRIQSPPALTADLKKPTISAGKIAAPLSRHLIPSGYINTRRRISSTRPTLEAVLSTRLPLKS